MEGKNVLGIGSGDVLAKQLEDGASVDSVGPEVRSGEQQKQQNRSHEVNFSALKDAPVGMEVDGHSETVNTVQEDLVATNELVEEDKEKDRSSVVVEQGPVVDCIEDKSAAEVADQDEPMSETSGGIQETVEAAKADEDVKMTTEEEMQSPTTIDNVESALQDHNLSTMQKDELGADANSTAKIWSGLVSADASEVGASVPLHVVGTTVGAVLAEAKNDMGTRLDDTGIAEEVQQTINTLMDGVIGLVDGIMVPSIADVDPVMISSSPMTTHLSTDEALELLEAHQDYDHHIPVFSVHDDGADADVEAEPMGSGEYQWFDEEDDDGNALVPSPSVLDLGQATDDVFGFDGVMDLSDVDNNGEENAINNSDESGDTVVFPSSSSSSSSSSSFASSGSPSSSSSSGSASSASDEEISKRQTSRKRQATNGGRKLLKYKKQKHFNGTLVKIREEQVDLQFLPMAPSDEEEDEDEDMGSYDSDDAGSDEPAASRYVVLGKGKNRFGRFLIRGYLNPETGRLNVKRRYLE
ncbi:hypothetical protein BBO99_00007393 [Phytophthora kernoviae]|uniref:Uncharacterized protein n=2 Tax=Phytophthora kernoviae TaxID=325452 RepID=A0A421FDP2_9STRA|nr:hypothetical protein G195_008215 [Phytophthora kernoviae 00238/432]KAG2519774.1 hypothetical protein JM16_007000 [Phytophthora kernoviae]KAG2520906.1 hypothetical protein JM18_006875 [Phytophthora kernoviae]RLN37803.1 hypothetical protein BBI17_006703 [Phytophthora kernoviae]RLN76629.1 hypothetical protein BBO99_00007393 [Phytophthora kernoviae]